MTPTLTAIILEGPAFDWADGARYSAKVVQPDGSVDWRAAAFADPGIMKCPGCGAYLWLEGWRVRCPECSTEWDTRGA